MASDQSNSLKYAACQVILYGHLADFIAVTECGLAEPEEFFDIKCFSHLPEGSQEFAICEW